MPDGSASSGSNFFLIGFMGSGKTHWGKIWALKNNLSFVDLDDLIEKKEGITISGIFEAKGEDYFRKAEAGALRDCAAFRNTIIASGGGTPCFFDNMKWMNDHGTTIYLEGTPKEIIQRLSTEQEKRPLVKELNNTALQLFIEQKIMERKPFYTQAHITVQSAMVTKESFARMLSGCK
ncbi:MAG: shikimate kinase [Ferruginibacter sp.]